MNRHSKIKNAYRSLGNETAFYDGMITCSILPGQVEPAEATGTAVSPGHG